MRSRRGKKTRRLRFVLSPRFSCREAGLGDCHLFPHAQSENVQKRGRTRNPPSRIIYTRLICPPVRSPRRYRGAYGVEPLSMVSSIAAMSAMRVDALHAKRQVYQPGLVPLSRTIREYHENPDISIPFSPLVPSLDKLIVATYTSRCRR